MSGEPGGAFVGGEQVRLEGCPADCWAAAVCGGRRRRLECVEPGQQIRVTVEEGAVDSGFSELGMRGQRGG